MKRLLFLVVLLIAEPIVAVAQSAASQEAAAPAFALNDLRGRTVRLKDYQGKVLLINFWATWCAPCRAEMPEMVKLQQAYKSRGLQIVGITLPPMSRKNVRRIVRQLKINYPLLFGTRGVAARYDVAEVLPLTIVVDRAGKIRARILGILEPEEFEQSIKPLLVNTGRQ